MKRILRNKDTGTVLGKYIKSFGHALSGIWYALKYEHNKSSVGSWSPSFNSPDLIFSIKY
jgi:hypothetical protein